MGTGQFYFSIEKLRSMLARFESPEFQRQVVGGRELKGFVFTAGRTENNQPCAYAFPVFSMPGDNMNDDTILYQNTDAGSSGCPYPPGCK